MGVSSVPHSPAFFGAIVALLSTAPNGVRRRDVIDRVADMMHLTPEQRAESLPSGTHLRYRHRIGWSLNLLKNAGLLEAPGHGIWKLSAEGQKFASKHGPELDDSTTRDIVRRARGAESGTDVDQSEGADSDGPAQSPEERVDAAVAELHSQLSKDLLDRIGKASPAFFEELVLNLLHSLGYGATTDDLQRVGKSGDGGIDGVIALDTLGLEKVYVQAKRWQGSVGRPDVQGFFGALAGQHAKKGVFITTSTFTKEARDFAQQVSDSIVLVDGTRLTTLMIDRGVAVSHYRTVKLARIDGDYFEED